MILVTLFVFNVEQRLYKHTMMFIIDTPKYT